MISYNPFFKTLKQKNITQYELQNKYGISRSTLGSLKHNKNITLFTVERLCSILDCKPEDIFEIIEEETFSEFLATLVK